MFDMAFSLLFFGITARRVPFRPPQLLFLTRRRVARRLRGRQKLNCRAGSEAKQD
ncbi:MAG TPA: hypothetical protein VE224_09280 [Pseudolabrys sp.]|nr:hypothetical protein [Pseudolabrys sp.]